LTGLFQRLGGRDIVSVRSPGCWNGDSHGRSQQTSHWRWARYFGGHAQTR